MESSRNLLVIALIACITVLLAILGRKADEPIPYTPPCETGTFPEHLKTHFTECMPFEELLWAIKMVESGGDPNAIGDDGEAVGAYQLWKIYVDDCNRIIGYDRWTYDDRYNELQSMIMVRIYLRHYATEKRLGHEPTVEDMARIHNGGPNGYKKASTLKYWEKVKGVILDGRH